MTEEGKEILLKEAISIARNHKSRSFAQVIAVIDMSHSQFYKNRFHKEKKLISIIEINKKDFEENTVERIVESIIEFRMYNGTEIAAFHGIHYDSYKEKYAALPEVKAAILESKRSVKQEVRNKLLENKSPAALLGLYKLLGTKEEVDRLNGSTKNIDITTQGKPIIQPVIISMNETDEEE